MAGHGPPDPAPGPTGAATPGDSHQSDILKGDADASKRDVDSRIDSLRREMDWQFRDRDLRVKSLERFRDFIESLIMYGILIGYAAVIVISVVIIIVEARGASQESEQPEERSLSSMKFPRAAPEERVRPGLRPMRHISVAPVAQHAFVIDTSGDPDSCLCGACFNLGPGQGFGRAVAERPDGPAALPGLVVPQKPRRRDFRAYSTECPWAALGRPAHPSFQGRLPPVMGTGLAPQRPEIRPPAISSGP